MRKRAKRFFTTPRMAAVQFSESAIRDQNFFFFVAVIKTTHKNHLCIFSKFEIFFGFKHLEYSIFLFGGTEGSKSCSDKSRHRVESYRFYLWIENLKTFSSTTGRFAFFQHNCKI